MMRIAIALVTLGAGLLMSPQRASGDRTPTSAARTSRAAASAESANTRADRHLAAGLALYQERNFGRAIAMFRAGYAIEPRLEFIYALGQAERLSGDCRSAIIYYRRFLSRVPAERAAKAAFEQITACEHALASGPASAAARTTRLDRARPLSAARPSVSHKHRSRPWYGDRLGDVLLGSGGLLLVGSGGLYLGARSASQAASSAESYAEFDRRAAQASSRRSWAIGASMTGVGLLAGAIYRFGWRRDGGKERRLVAVPRAGGAVLSVAGGW